jgi:hypothetical protein
MTVDTTARRCRACNARRNSQALAAEAIHHASILNQTMSWLCRTP